jgi:hypothetical protein
MTRLSVVAFGCPSLNLILSEPCSNCAVNACPSLYPPFEKLISKVYANISQAVRNRKKANILNILSFISNALSEQLGGCPCTNNLQLRPESQINMQTPEITKDHLWRKSRPACFANSRRREWRDSGVDVQGCNRSANTPQSHQDSDREKTQRSSVRCPSD